MKTWLFTLCCLLPLPAGAQNNYIIFRPRTDAQNIVRIYIDRAGNIYPREAKIDPGRFPCTSRKCNTYANIRAYYEQYDAAAGKLLYSRYGVSSFEGLEERLITEIAGDVNKQLDKYKVMERNLVVLIHGFNDYGDRTFDTLVKYVNNACASPVYLEVYWDGLKASSEDFGDVNKIWFRANKTAPYAALTLRRLMQHIDTNARVYMIAHSLGACVGTRTLFNTNDRKHFPLKKQWRELPTPPQRDVTLALIAPAIPGKRIFRHIDKTTPAGNAIRYTRLVIGYNRKDYATTKKMRFPLSYMFWSTALGCNPGVVGRTGDVALKHRPGIQFSTTDLTGCSNSKHMHHIYQYSVCDKFEDLTRSVFR